MLKKRNIFLIGPMGSGKSTVGKKLAEKLGFSFFDSDNEIERISGVNIAWIFDVEGERGFRKREIKIISELVMKNNVVLATGGGSIISYEVRNFLVSNGVVIYLKVGIDTQLARTRFDKSRPLILLEESKKYAIFQRLSNERSLFYEEIFDLKICVDNKSIDTINNEIIKFLEEIQF
ncbi:Shikimate kinase 1 [Candidatus Westeberhardia cardiocondylae]|uniref:Shikimate kinase 1 n=1 Tax=Candidatus Westeberhardia cardiocondylae TaxID=1594731 RepID=A0A0H5BWN6_9ENTR|nr:shikimate kinase AroK [Candidatus Westeberhardia cardiocondylae]MCR3756147.1 shikimate kinase 1 [Candidatus Westeberhardia cardiocondylae]CEN32024.1 Shikimate kinase 1 [Candidatus Westeberhardia cardiocondylae]